MSDVIVFIRHIRQVSHCSRGARDFFHNHNLNWQDFLENGIKSSILEEIDDYMARQVVDCAKKEALKNGE